MFTQYEENTKGEANYVKMSNAYQLALLRVGSNPADDRYDAEEKVKIANLSTVTEIQRAEEDNGYPYSISRSSYVSRKDTPPSPPLKDIGSLCLSVDIREKL